MLSCIGDNEMNIYNIIRIHLIRMADGDTNILLKFLRDKLDIKLFYSDLRFNVMSLLFNILVKKYVNMAPTRMTINMAG